MSADDLISIGLNQQHGQNIFPVAFQSFPFCAGAPDQLRHRQLSGLQQLTEKLCVFSGVADCRAAGLQRSLLLRRIIRHIRKGDAEVLHHGGQFCNLLSGCLPLDRFLLMISVICQLLHQCARFIVLRLIQGEMPPVPGFPTLKINQAASDHHGSVA